jgi:hypothetical protein
MKQEDFETALKELEHVLYHRLQEKFQLVKTVLIHIYYLYIVGI